MFTGIIEEMGQLLSRQPCPGGGAKLRIQAHKVLEGVRLGDSIAVNGVCLTVTDFGQHHGDFDALGESLRLTNLGTLPEGSRVNLERSLAVGARVGGHFVTGHVDGPATLIARTISGNGVQLRFSHCGKFAEMIAPKGSITVNGVSLTVVEVSPKSFSLWIVPHTLQATNLGSLQLGDNVNLETDILAKYLVHSKTTPSTDRAAQLSAAGFF